MDEFMMNHLRRGMNEQDFRNKFRNFMNNRYNRESGMPQDTGNSYRRNNDFFEGSNFNMNRMEEEDFMNYRRHSNSAAQSLVSSMYHKENGKRISGEKFDMEKAKKVKEKYSDLLQDVPVEEVYIALNAQYHDYAPLFKTWFREGIEHKIIESAIVFWFCDVDYQGESKVEDYFNR